MTLQVKFTDDNLTNPWSEVYRPSSDSSIARYLEIDDGQITLISKEETGQYIKSCLVPLPIGVRTDFFCQWIAENLDFVSEVVVTEDHYCDVQRIHSAFLDEYADGCFLIELDLDNSDYFPDLKFIDEDGDTCSLSEAVAVRCKESTISELIENIIKNWEDCQFARFDEEQLEQLSKLTVA